MNQLLVSGFEGKKAEDRRSISSALGQLSESGADLINVSGLVRKKEK